MRARSWQRLLRALAAAALAAALWTPAGPTRAQLSDSEREFLLERVLKGGTGNVHDLLRDANGTLWVASQAGLFALRDGVLVRAPAEDRTGLVKVLLEAQGSVWAGGEQGLFRVGADGMRRVPGPETRLVYALAESGGSLWLGARNGLFRVEDGSLRRPPQAEPGAVTALLADGSTLWIGADGLLRAGPAGLQRVEGLASGWVRALAKPGSDLWVGGDEGVFRLRDARPAALDGERTGRVYALEPANAGGVWIGAFNGLFAGEAGRVVQRGPADLKGILALREDGDTLWIGGLRGLARRRGGEVAAVPGEATGWVGALLKDGETLWIGAEHGLFRLQNGAMLRIGTREELASGTSPNS